jgi:hypothetical protein
MIPVILPNLPSFASCEHKAVARAAATVNEQLTLSTFNTSSRIDTPDRP